jgi:hypothetical protein
MASSSSNPSIEVLGASEDPVFEELHSALREFVGADAEEVDQALDRCRGCELDQTIDTVAELMLADVTMREEKRKRQAARKDQKFGAPSSSTAGPQTGLGRDKGKGGLGPGDGKGRGRQTIEDPKAKTKCFDSSQAGRWSEEPSCPKPSKQAQPSQPFPGSAVGVKKKRPSCSPSGDCKETPVQKKSPSCSPSRDCKETPGASEDQVFDIRSALADFEGEDVEDVDQAGCEPEQTIDNIAETISPPCQPSPGSSEVPVPPFDGVLLFSGPSPTPETLAAGVHDLRELIDMFRNDMNDHMFYVGPVAGVDSHNARAIQRLSTWNSIFRSWVNRLSLHTGSLPTTPSRPTPATPPALMPTTPLPSPPPSQPFPGSSEVPVPPFDGVLLFTGPSPTPETLAAGVHDLRELIDIFRNDMNDHMFYVGPVAGVDSHNARAIQRLSTWNSIFRGAELEGADAGMTEPHREADTSDAASSGSEDGEGDYGVCDSCGLRAATQWTQPECLDCYREHC